MMQSPLVQRILVLLGAGLGAAVLFVIPVKGTLIAMVIAFVAPLPIMIAALGFGHMTGLGCRILRRCCPDRSLPSPALCAHLRGDARPAVLAFVLARPAVAAEFGGGQDCRLLSARRPARLDRDHRRWQRRSVLYRCRRGDLRQLPGRRPKPLRQAGPAAARYVRQ